jgi:hypothetical protein
MVHGIDSLLVPRYRDHLGFNSSMFDMNFPFFVKECIKLDEAIGSAELDLSVLPMLAENHVHNASVLFSTAAIKTSKNGRLGRLMDRFSSKFQSKYILDLV